MTDVPSRLRAPEKRMSLAEMAAKAASKSLPPSRSRRPNGTPGPRAANASTAPRTAAPSLAPPSLTPAVQHLWAPSVAAPAGPALAARQRVALNRPSRLRGGSAGLLLALVGLATAYGLAASKGIDPVEGARGFLARQRTPTAPASTAAAGSTSSPVAVNANATAAPGLGDNGAAARTAEPAQSPALSLDAAKTNGPVDPSAADLKTGARLPRQPDRAIVAHAAPVAGKPLAASPAPMAPSAAVAVAPQAKPALPAAAAEPEQGGLAGAIKKAVGPSDAPLAPVVMQAGTQPIRGDIPEVPAQGAIQGALGGQRGAARSCVAGQEAPSRASIVFASTGQVQSVAVSGPAAGTPAEACIRAAYAKAMVGPFRRPSFSLSTTITPP